MKRSRERNSIGLFTSHSKSCDSDGARSLEIHSNVISNWSSWTNISLTPEQIDTSFADLATEKAIVTLPTSGVKNEDVDEVIEYIDVISKCKNDSPITVIASSDLNIITIRINDDFSINIDHRSVNPHFSHDVKCIDICEKQPSSSFSSSINDKGTIELGLALEGLDFKELRQL